VLGAAHGRMALIGQPRIERVLQRLVYAVGARANVFLQLVGQLEVQGRVVGPGGSRRIVERLLRLATRPAVPVRQGAQHLGVAQHFFGG
jgi:hypothetical protein